MIISSTKRFVLPVAFALLLVAGSAKADITIYQATTNDNGNGLAMGPDGVNTPPAGTGGYWEMGNTITFSGTARDLTTVNLTVYGGGDVNYPFQMDIYSGSSPTGTPLGTATAPAGYGTNTTTFNFSGLVVPNTVTFIVSLPNQNGSYDSIYLYPVLTSGAGPTVGSGPNSLWYSTTGGFVANDTYAIADGASTNFLQAQFNATVAAPEPGLYGVLGVGLAGLLFAIRRRKIV